MERIAHPAPAAADRPALLIHISSASQEDYSLQDITIDSDDDDDDNVDEPFYDFLLSPQVNQQFQEQQAAAAAAVDGGI